MIISKDIVSFDGGYFEFLQDELKSLVKNICEKFKEKVVKNYLVFGLVGVLLKKNCVSAVTIQYYVCTRFFVDVNDLGAIIDQEFITYEDICHLPISTLIDQVKQIMLF